MKICTLKKPSFVRAVKIPQSRRTALPAEQVPQSKPTDHLSGKCCSIHPSSIFTVWIIDVEKETPKAILCAAVAYGINDGYGRIMGRCWIPKIWLSLVEENEVGMEFKLNRWGEGKLKWGQRDKVEQSHGKKLAEYFRRRKSIIKPKSTTK